MTKDDIPFEKVLLAIDIFEMSLSDLDAEVKFKNADTRPQPRKSDELYLATHPREAYVLLLVCLGFKIKEIQSELEITRVQIDRMLIDLSKNNLVSFENDDKIRPLIAPPIAWSPNGLFARRYYPPLVKVLASEAIEMMAGYNLGPHSNSDALQFGEVYMSAELESEFRQELASVITRFKKIARIENSNIPLAKLQPVAFLSLAKRFPVWRTVMWGRG